MKKIILPFFCAVVFATPAIAQKTSAAPVKTTASASKITSQQVIDNYIAALGGRAKLEAVKSTIIDNTINAQGMEINSVTIKMGNKFKSVQSVMGQEVTQVFDGEKGYMNQMGNKTDIPANQIEELKNSRTIDALGYDASKFQTVTVEKIDGKDYHVLGSDKGKFYFDAATGLLYKAGTPQGDAVMKSYMTVEGIKFPELIEAEGSGQKVSIKTNKITLNSGVSETDFN